LSLIEIRLHRGYNIPATKLTGRKYGQQFAGPVNVLERVGRLAYRLDLPEHWKIHPVLTIAMLEPCLSPHTNPFNRIHPTNPDPVNADRDDLDEPEWEVSRILDQRQIRRRRAGVILQYLVRWEGYGAHEDSWIKASDVFADDLVREYEAHRAVAPLRPKSKRQRG